VGDLGDLQKTQTTGLGVSVPLAEAMLSPVNIVGGQGYSFLYFLLG